MELPDSLRYPQPIDLLYNEAVSGLGNTSMYNGNISAMRWSNNLGLGDVKERGYKFDYDPMNRLTAATQKTYKTVTAWTPSSAYHESGLSGIVVGKDEDGKLQIAQAGVQGGGKSINASTKTNTEGVMWAGSKSEMLFVGAGRPLQSSVTPGAGTNSGQQTTVADKTTFADKIKAATDNINSATSEVQRLQSRISAQKDAGKNTNRLQTLLDLEESRLRTNTLLVQIYQQLLEMNK